MKQFNPYNVDAHIVSREARLMQQEKSEGALTEEQRSERKRRERELAAQFGFLPTASGGNR